MGEDDGASVRKRQKFMTVVKRTELEGSPRRNRPVRKEYAKVDPHSGVDKR